jgi:hypothetical protein
LVDQGCVPGCAPQHHKVESWLIELPPPPPVRREPLKPVTRTRWGGWVYDPDTNELVLRKVLKPGGPPLDWEYIDLDRCTTSVAVLEQIIRAGIEKTSIEPRMVVDLLHALYDRLPMHLFRPGW